jgi:hypothetical protein
MVPRCFDLEMEWGHVAEEADIYKVVRIGSVLGAVFGSAVEEARDGPDGLQKSRHADVVE